MALTKVIGSGVEGISNASNATFLTATAAEGVTLAGTLAVTGVHTVGTNAVATSEGGAVTQNLLQGLCKAWVKLNGTSTAAINNSFNTSGITDEGTGHYSNSFTNNFDGIHYVVSGTAMHPTATNAHVVTLSDNSGQDGTPPVSSGYEVRSMYIATSSVNPHDCTIVSVSTVGDLA